MENLRDLLLVAISTNAYADKVKFQSALYEKTFKVVFTIAASWFREEAEDMVQSIFAKVFNLPLESLVQPVETTAAAMKYMTKVTLNHRREVWRKKKEQQERIERYSRQALKVASSYLEDGLIDTDYLLRHLSRKEAQVITLQFNHDLEDCEIRERLKLPSNGAVRKHRQRALMKLRQIQDTST